MAGALTESTLDPALLRSALGAAADAWTITAVAECDSSNTRLMALAESGAADNSVWVADRQTAGRGRRGRIWHSSGDTGLTFSLLKRFPPDSEAPVALSLVTGIAVAKALETLGAPIALKWPNDVLHHGRKLAGILIELQPGNVRSAVIGIGLNLGLPPDLPSDVANNAAALDRTLPGIRRETVLAALLLELSRTYARYVREGFAGLREDWCQRDAYAGQSVELSGEGERQSGICRGVDIDGALLLEQGTQRTRIMAGEVSLRPRVEASS